MPLDTGLKYHAPGLAPIVTEQGAYHVHRDGTPAYTQRFEKSYGFYDQLAAVVLDDLWFHIHPDGSDAYTTRFAWCGNFQQQCCSVMGHENHYYHIDTQGSPLYEAKYAYAGDFRNGVATVQNHEGLHTHIDATGNYLHGVWFFDLDVYHKGYARAKDDRGWCHINASGAPLYAERYAMVEPFYNERARVQTFSGKLQTIDTYGNCLTPLHTPTATQQCHALSADLVGFWKTQTLYAAVKLGVCEHLPATTAQIAMATGLSAPYANRLLYALGELDIVNLQCDTWQLTTKGQLLCLDHPHSMAAAAHIWGEDHYQSWAQLEQALQGKSIPTTYFSKLGEQPEQLKRYHQAIRPYAELDYTPFVMHINWNQHHRIIDAGGSTGQLLSMILKQAPHLDAHLLDRPEVVALACRQQPNLTCHGSDFFHPWPLKADAVLLARVLHDWDDAQATSLLQQARKACTPNGKIYVLDMVLPEQGYTGRLLDLNMLVMTGGQERTLLQWKNLFAAAELHIRDCHALSPIVQVITLTPNAEQVTCPNL